ncbi:hypothetical protein PCL_11114 [Purpureocillium lilacinum]|uniref:Uncharacterized protein n=1 Tax=Purpureocillium lilacinum TaxID=33203 RepID=A0A2U3ED91_PURLI|nr:hypothetical protein PCL_11114 [Purpureocillium lilacinum]
MPCPGDALLDMCSASCVEPGGVGGPRVVRIWSVVETRESRGGGPAAHRLSHSRVACVQATTSTHGRRPVQHAVGSNILVTRHVHVLLRISAVDASSGSMRDESPAFETLRRRSQTRGGRWLGKGGETRGAGETLELTPRSPCREIDSRRLRETARAESEQPCGRFTELRAGCTYGRESLDFA